MKKIKLILTGVSFLAGIFLFMTGCPVTPAPPEVKDPMSSSEIEENSALFIEDADTGIISFYTNDTKYSGMYGYTLWTEGDAVQNPFTHLNVTLKKISGNDVAGYGVVFAHHDNTMLVVLINTKKEFIIGELTGNLFTEIQAWTNSTSLISGFNHENIIDVTYDSGTKDFSLSFNAGNAVIFRDDEEPFHTSGKDGYMVVISPLDNFPNVPVSISFKKN